MTATYTTSDALAWQIRTDSQRVQRTADQLQDEMRSLARGLLRAADTLAESSLAELPHAVNRLGEVQGRGLEIDRLCALLAERSDALGGLHSIRLMLEAEAAE